MCGRFVINIPLNVFLKYFGLREVGDIAPCYNVPPSRPVPVIREAVDGSRCLATMRWGLIPSWAKEAGEGLINAIIRPILILLTLPLNILTLGLFTLVINALLIMLAAAIVPGFTVQGFWWALLFGLVLAVINYVLGAIAF